MIVENKIQKKILKKHTLTLYLQVLQKMENMLKNILLFSLGFNFSKTCFYHILPNVDKIKGKILILPKT